MHLCALYLLFLPPLLSGRPRDSCWCPCDRLCLWRPFFLYSRASRQAPPLIIPISPIPFSHACIRFYYCNWFLLFWCIDCFCTCYCIVPAYPQLLSIGWLVIHQWTPPCPCCPCFIIDDSINVIDDQSPTPHITSRPFCCSTLQNYQRVPRVIPRTSLLMRSL